MKLHALHEPILPEARAGYPAGCTAMMVAPGRLLAISAKVAACDGVVDLDADRIVVRPFSPAEAALRAELKAFAQRVPRRVRLRWVPW